MMTCEEVTSVLTFIDMGLDQALFIAAQCLTYLGAFTFLTVCLIVCYRWEEDISKQLVKDQWFQTLLICVFASPVVLWWLFRFVALPASIRVLHRIV
jgi:hypothetical protein